MNIDEEIRSVFEHYQTGNLEQARCICDRILESHPDNVEALNLLGRICRAKGQFDEALIYVRRAVRIRPDNYGLYQNLVFSMLYNSRHVAHTLFSEHLQLARQFEGTLLPGVLPHANEKTPNRRLKIGYVSPDFRRHSVAYFIEPILLSHSREHFELFCYSLTSLEDEVTARMKRYADQWKNIAGMEDHQAAELIRTEGIDILVDLAGHAYNSRILIFARKPAPVQASWIGYPATTGFSSMDYKIVDGYTDPPGVTEQFYSEKLMRLPGCFLCYLPDKDSPEVGTLPVLISGEITFGSFNDFAKVTPEVVALWSAILKRIPDSTLMLKAISFSDRGIHQYVNDMFAKHGIDSERIELLPFAASFPEHLSLYNQIDIGLDPFPYNGTTTTCEALWMGVPVVTLAGNTHASRVGVSLLSNIGLPELIAETPDEYVAIAVTLAADVNRLQSLRARLRAAMEQSPLTDAARFTLNLENCYRKMWETWCASGETYD
jgi:protein O-GlcNAc transferase